LFENTKKNALEKLEEEREKRKEYRNFIKTIHELAKDSDVRNIINVYDKPLRYVFTHYINTVTIPVNMPFSHEVLYWDGFKALISDFNVIPGLINPKTA